ncbi:MAG: hypothetical protein WA761_02995 [Thermoplasmata archaeon]|jgi:uncharacterized membrane protein
MTAMSGLTGVDTGPIECRMPSRFWIIPIAVIGTLLALAAVFTYLSWAGIIAAPVYSGPASPYGFLIPLGLGLVWVLVFFVLRPWRGRGQRAWPDRVWRAPPEGIVRARYARGEISREEMRARLQDLQEGGSSERRAGVQ